MAKRNNHTHIEGEFEEIKEDEDLEPTDEEMEEIQESA
jgi:hypothetical protein